MPAKTSCIGSVNVVLVAALDDAVTFATAEVIVVLLLHILISDVFCKSRVMLVFLLLLPEIVTFCDWLAR